MEIRITPNLVSWVMVDCSVVCMIEESDTVDVITTSWICFKLLYVATK